MSAPSGEMLARLARLLSAWGHPAALIGGMAMAARVRQRPTVDLDVVISVPPGAEESLLQAAAREGYTWDEERTRQFLPGGLVQLIGPDGVRVDLLFASDPLSESVLQRATDETLLGVTLSVATVEDLLLMKLEANRPTDLDDAIAIKDAFGETLDRAYLRGWARRLDLEARLEALVGAEDSGR